MSIQQQITRMEEIAHEEAINNPSIKCRNYGYEYGYFNSFMAGILDQLLTEKQVVEMARLIDQRKALIER